MDGRMTVLSDRFDLELADARERCTELETQLSNTIERNAVLEREMANMRERVERLEEANVRDRGETQQDMANGDPQQWRQEGGPRWGWRRTDWSQ